MKHNLKTLQSYIETLPTTEEFPMAYEYCTDLIEELHQLNFSEWYEKHKQEIIERFIPKRITTEKTIITGADVVQFFVEHEILGENQHDETK